MQLVDVARTYVDTPFHHAGRLPGVGLDCIGVPVCAAIACGFDVEDVRAYPLRPNGMLQSIMESKLLRVDTRREGDVLLMRFDQALPHHLALLTGPTIIHAHIAARKCVEQDFTEWWADRVMAIYRFKELA